ncbi:MAG: hypothetical protein GEU80_04805 [Dehalococcoidia bacterium]|nr:hypothetical protein [Dehalococcoidia bacterium]
MYVINDELKTFIESGVAVVIGTADDEGRPHMAYAWGPRVHEDRVQVSLFIDAARSATPLRDLDANGRIAVTLADPVSYRSVQLKGRAAGHGEPVAGERAWVERHRDAFMASTALVGDAPSTIRNLWMEDVIRVDFEVEQAFNQTPGPGAGVPL